MGVVHRYTLGLLSLIACRIPCFSQNARILPKPILTPISTIHDRVERSSNARTYITTQSGSGVYREENITVSELKNRPNNLYQLIPHARGVCNSTKLKSPRTTWDLNDIMCGEWQIYGNNSFKTCFLWSGLNYISEHPAMPDYADEACHLLFGATLASLSEQGARHFVADLIRRCSTNDFPVSIGIRRVKPVSRRLKHLYRFLWQWGGQGSPIAYRETLTLQTKGAKADCALFNIRTFGFMPISCIYYDSKSGLEPGGYVCMKPNTNSTTDKLQSSGIKFPRASKPPAKFPTKQCPDGSVVHTFLCCRWDDVEEGAVGCSPNNLPFFQCLFGNAIHYSLVCDGNDDCADRSDETDCQLPQFDPLLTSSFICKNFQAITMRQRCNGRPDCFDESDEESCVSCQAKQMMCFGVGCIPYRYVQYFETCPALTFINYQVHEGLDFNLKEVILDGDGMIQVRLQNKTCSEGFYPCQSGYCIPTYLFNNGEKDCLLGEDEIVPAHDVVCPDYYRCRRSGSCVHNEYVCDGVHHCPYKDDELLCDWSCPVGRGCTCEGQAYTCSKMIDPLQNLHVRYLDVSHASNVSLENIHFMEYLFFLNLSSCHLGKISLKVMLHLQTLDLSFNSLREISSLNLRQLSKLVSLNLSNNPLEQSFSSTFSTLLNGGTVYGLKTLILTNVGLEMIKGEGFSSLSKLTYLDIRANPIHSLDRDSLFGLTALEDLYTDETRLCCNYFHSTLPRCFAPIDELSSCSDLLAQDFFRVCLWVLSVLTVSGNTGILIYRQFIKKQNLVSPSLILVKNLCAADFLMGLYMVMIGVADTMFSGVYVAKGDDWKRSTACTVAGFLSFVSSEVSALVICLITMDRALVMCFPFNSRVHFSPMMTRYACLTVWVTGISLASVPLLVGLEFYGQNAICIPLPITRRRFSGQVYAFCVFIVLNFVLFVSIGLGQLFIYRAVRNASTAAGTKRREQDLTIARRLFLVAFTDFCCWFPIGLMGLLAVSGTPIPDLVNVWVAIFVLPLNSALNPFLYTLNGLMEKARKQRMEKKMKKILGNLQTEIQKWQPASVQELMKICIRSKLVGAENMKDMFCKDKGSDNDDASDHVMKTSA